MNFKFKKILDSQIHAEKKNDWKILYNPKSHNRLNIPERVSLDLTYDCNLNCGHCYVTHKTEKYDLQNILKIQKILFNSGVRLISYIGGEPFCITDLPEIISNGYKLGLDQEINSNGLLINADTISYLKKYNVKLNISVDGPNSNAYKKTRKNNLFRTLIKNIKDCVYHGILITVVFTVNDDNLSQIDKMLSLVKKLNVNSFYLRYYTCISNCNNKISKWSWFKIQLIRRYLHILSNFKILSFVFSDSLDRGGCFARSTINIGPEGNLRFCTLFDKSTFLGNILQDDLIALWNSEKMASLYDFRNIGEPCNSCLFKFSCQVICRAEIYSKTNDYFSGDKTCSRGKISSYIQHFFKT